MNKIDIVMTTWKREKITKLSIQAFKQNTTYPHRLIIIDGGSSKEAQSYYAQVADIYIKLDKNRGLEYAKWLGMKFVESPLFISTDNDILPHKFPDDEPDWLSRLVDIMNRRPEYGAIALRPQVLIGTGNIFDGKTDEVIDFGHVPGYARIMRTKAVEESGAWNEWRELRGHEEYWIGEKFKAMGLKMGFANHIKCWHMFGDDTTDKWGYDKEGKPEDHGHNEVAGIPGNDRETILKEVGIDIWETA